MSARSRGHELSLREVLTIIGNGNPRMGREIIDDIATRLIHARTKHPDSQWAGQGDDYALEAIEDEVREVRVAMKIETSERVYSELLDSVATIVRTMNNEQG